MDNLHETREFLTSRRAKVTPDRVDLPTGSNRRVPGLRRSEVALLANVSVEYYAKVERGDLSGVSDVVLDAIARALLLEDAERSHLFDLARAANGSPLRTRRPMRRPSIRPSVQFTLDAITGGAAFVRNGRMDILATNRLGHALYSELYIDPARPADLARFAFLHQDRAERFYPDWDGAADVCVAILRTEAGRNPYDKEIQDLVGELSTRSEEFRTRWAKHNVRHHSSGSKLFHHPVVGDLHLVYEGMGLMADAGLNLLVYSAQPGSSSEDALRLLASWAATQDESDCSADQKLIEREA